MDSMLALGGVLLSVVVVAMGIGWAVFNPLPALIVGLLIGAAWLEAVRYTDAKMKRSLQERVDAVSYTADGSED